MRHLAGVFFLDPPTSRKRRRRPRELSVSPTDFSIKLRKRPAGSRWDPPPSPSTDAPSPLSRMKKGVASTPARENSIPRIIQTCRWKDGVRGEKHFNGDYGSRGYSDATRPKGDAKGLGKRKDESRSLRGENVRNRGKAEVSRVSQIVSYKSRNSLSLFCSPHS